MTRKQVLDKIKELLENAFGERLMGVVLYGSEARGEADDDSDLDFLVLLKGPVRFGRDLETIIEAVYPLQLEMLGSGGFGDNRIISAIPAEAAVYESGAYALFRNAMREGIRL